MEFDPTFLLSRQPQSFSRLLQRCTANNHLLMLNYYMTVTRLQCLPGQARYLVDIVEVLTSRKHASLRQVFPLWELGSPPKRYYSTMLRVPLKYIEVAFEV